MDDPITALFAPTTATVVAPVLLPPPPPLTMGNLDLTKPW